MLRQRTYTVYLASYSFLDASNTILQTGETFSLIPRKSESDRTTLILTASFDVAFHSVMVIEETAGSVKNILSLGEVPTTFTKFTFDQIDLSGVRWEVRSNRTDWTILMVPGLLNRLNGQEGQNRRLRHRLTRGHKIR